MSVHLDYPFSVNSHFQRNERKNRDKDGSDITYHLMSVRSPRLLVFGATSYWVCLTFVVLYTLFLVCFSVTLFAGDLKLTSMGH